MLQEVAMHQYNHKWILHILKVICNVFKHYIKSPQMSSSIDSNSYNFPKSIDQSDFILELRKGALEHVIIACMKCPFWTVKKARICGCFANDFQLCACLCITMQLEAVLKEPCYLHSPACSNSICCNIRFFLIQQFWTKFLHSLVGES